MNFVDKAGEIPPLTTNSLPNKNRENRGNYMKCLLNLCEFGWKSEIIKKIPGKYPAGRDLRRSPALALNT
jgi:hypothetical protein